MERTRLARGVVELIRRDAPALALFLALTIGMTNPLALHIASAVEDKQDALLNTWIVAWVGHALITDPLHLFNANIFSPYPNALAFSETLLPQGLFALPFNLAFDNTILGYNFVLLASFLLAAYAMYLFVFDLTRSRGAGIIAGTIFAFNPYNLGNLAQVQLLSFGWMPLLLLFLRRVLQTDRRPLTADRQRGFRISDFGFRNAFLFALFFALQSLSSFYYAFLAGFTVALYVLWSYFAKWRDATHHAPRTTHYASRFTLHASLISLALSVALIAVLVTPFFLPYLQVQRDLGFERKIAESEPFSASLKLYAEVSPQNVAYGNFLAPRPPIFSGGYPRDNLFPGFIALALALLGITARRRDKWFYFALFAFAFVLSLGPRLYLTPTQPTDLTLPYRWLYDFFPLARALRAPVRFDALVMFALAILAGLGIQKAVGSMQKAKYAFLLSAFCFLLSAFEYLALPAAQTTRVPTADAFPQSTHWLAQQPHTTILELPMLASAPTVVDGGTQGGALDLTTQYLSTYHWHATPDGYSGFIPPKRGEIAYEMQAFPSERAVSLLQTLDVEYVVIHADQFADWATRREAIGRAPDLRLVKQAGNDFIYRVTPRSQDAVSLSARLYIPNPAAPDSTFTAYLIVQNRGARSFAVKPTDVLQIEWSGGRTSTVLPLVTSTVSVVPIRLSAPPRAGDYELQLRVTSAAIGEWQVSGNLQVRNEEPARQVIIPAQVALNAPLNAQYAPSATVSIGVTWMPLNKVDAYYSASVRVVDARGNKIVAQDREPIVSTFLWTPNVPVQDTFTLTLPRDLAAGQYSVQLLMYQAEQGVDALLLDEDFAPRESVVLGSFKVK